MRRAGLSTAFQVLLISVCSAFVVYGQRAKSETKPNLSGMWALDRNRSKMSRLPSGAEETIEITHAAPELKIRRYLTVNGKMTEKELTYFTDGRGETNPATIWISTNRDSTSSPAKETQSKTKWETGRIVTRATLRVMIGIHAIEEDVVDEWVLSPDGKTLTRTTRFYLQRSATEPVMITAQNADDKRVYTLVSR